MRYTAAVGKASQTITTCDVALPADARLGCTAVFTYAPSRRVLEEGGYEPERSMLYYGHPGPFAAEVEEILVRKVREVVARVREE
jgi:hypothetical protein